MMSEKLSLRNARANARLIPGAAFAGCHPLRAPSFRSELVIENGITIEGGPATIGSAGRPLTLRGVIRALNPGATIEIIADPFTNDGGTIEELNGGSVTINGQ